MGLVGRVKPSWSTKGLATGWRGGVPAWIPYYHACLITLKIDTTSAG